ncbi:MAG TPA: type II toxin-antitoxin system RelE/ParE family toxin [Thermoanaerobaculia bacterium]|nr:type II toxin-antitoxin system RelE/ParE family toxin [Thermoanaerobaculia bacterium]
MHQILLTDSALRFYERAERSLQLRLDRCFEQLRANPHAHPNIKRLRGKLSGRFRYRIGDYRVIYRLEEGDRVVIVLLIEHRSEVYQ